MIQDWKMRLYWRLPVFLQEAALSFYAARHEMGVVAMRKLHTRMETEREPPAKIVLYGELIVRESTVV